MDIEIFIATFISALFGLILGAVIGSEESNYLIAECQAELPRNQTCILTAVPASIEE
jgi:hypothetical protein